MAMPQPASQSKLRSRPYRRFLTSSLHQRFVHASALALIVCWNNAFWLGKKSSYFWSWFPISAIGLRALLLFGSSLAVFILRVASLRFGDRVTSSPFAALWRSVLDQTTIQIAFWYLASAWWFSEVYIWLSSPSDNLGWIVKGDLSTPDRLNERPLYLRSVFLMLAVCQTLLHLYNDYSCVSLPVSVPKKTPTPDNRTHKLRPIKLRLQAALPKILRRCVIVSALLALSGPFIYALLLRQTFWSWHVSFAKLIYNLPRSDARPSGYPPSTPSFMLRSFAVSFLLMLAWETTSLFFSTFLAQEPLKKDQPLSASSKDPNGTLVTGLRAKRDVVKTFAFWELVIITQKHPERRKSIFVDIEREDGPVWTQMLHSALEVVQSVNARIEAATRGNPKPPEPAEDVNTMEIDSLPRIAAPIKVKPIYTDSSPSPRTRAEELETYIERGALRIGQSRRPFQPSIPSVQDIIKYLGPAGSPLEKVSSRSMTDYVSSYVDDSPIGWFLRTNFERKINTIVLGSLYANAAIIVDAVEATTRMLVASLSEDIYGKAIAGVPGTVRTFTNAVQGIEMLAQHVDEEAAEESDIEQVEAVLARLKAGLAELLSAFQLYLTDHGLSAAEYSQAQNASRPGRLLPEPHERKRMNGNDVTKPSSATLQQQQQQQQQSTDQRRDRSRQNHGTEASRDNERYQRGMEGSKPEGGKINGDGGDGPSQRRLGPQDPTTKKLFADVIPQQTARREMEMVR